ncbi:MAG: glycosyltransferase, partial [Candidatus Kapaibacterium sp.]
MYLSLIIPAYKEATRIGVSLEKIFAYFASVPYEVEILVVDDGSPDNSVEVIREALLQKKTDRKIVAKLIELGTNQGKGGAVRTGMLQAKGAIRIFTDADLST